MARVTGTTTKQMQDAANGAYFVWVHGDLSYPRSLARKIGREDLMIVSPSFFAGDRWRGIEFTGIVLDHATDLGESDGEKWRNYNRACERIRPDASGDEPT